MSENFQLIDGRVITDENQSRRLTLIANEHPEMSKDEISPYEWDERGMSELFALCYNDECKYCVEAKEWYYFKDGAWRKDNHGILAMAKLIEFSRLMDLYLLCIPSTDKRDDYRKLLNKLGTRKFREQVLKDAQCNEMVLVSARDFDANPYLINCKNGTWNLQTNEWHNHDSRDLLTMQTSFNYMPWEKGHYARWDEFIFEVMQGDKEKARYLQKCAGYSLLGKSLEAKFFILYGRTTRNGKSVFLDSIETLLGDYASVSSPALICKTSAAKDGDKANPMLASLKGKRFVTMSESDQYGKIDEGLLKQLTGGEELKVRGLFEKPFTFTPQFSLFLSANDLPQVLDKSVFYSERMVVIEFNRHFTEQEQDKKLGDKFKTEEAQRGIFEWLLDGYRLYVEEGLNAPAPVVNAVKQYARENDLVLQFLEDKCEKGSGNIRSKLLYDNYKVWCKNNGSYVCTARKFYSEMDAHPEWYDDKRVLHGYLIYDGLSIKNGD